jgi:hypothetical protein
MAADWHPSMGFEVLTSRLFRGVTFASLSGHPITSKDTVDVGVCVLNRTGLFGKEYKAWILRGNNPSNAINFAAFKSFWENAVQIAAFTAVPASSHGYGMGLANDDDDTASLTDAISSFGTAYTATQESLRSNTANINVIQGQLQMLCQALGNGQPPPGVINYQQRPRGGRGRGQQRGGNNGGRGGYGNHNGGNQQIANGGGGGYNGGNRNAAAAAATTAAAAQTVADTVPSPATPPRRSSVSKTGTTATAACMVAMWTTSTPARHAPAQERTTSAWRHVTTPWVAPCTACPRQFFPVPQADKLQLLAPPLHPSTTLQPTTIRLATKARVCP